MTTILPHKCLRCWKTSRSTRWNTQVRAYLCSDEARCFGRAAAAGRLIEEEGVWPYHEDLEDTLELPIDDTSEWPSLHRVEDHSQPKWTRCNECTAWTQARWLRDGYYCRKCRTTAINFVLR